jgi:hypothetical protein
LQNLHPVGGQPDANFIRLVASRMQTIDKFGYFYWIAATWMQFESGWRPTELNLHPVGGRLNEICIRLIEICIPLNEICIQLAAN